MLQEADIGVGISGFEGMQVKAFFRRIVWPPVQVIFAYRLGSCSYESLSLCVMQFLGSYVKRYSNWTVPLYGALITCTWSLVLQKDLFNGNSFPWVPIS